ncbi:oxidoreductase [Kitasatospora sp. Root187]|uniref:SDR family NAD(P)-dependent oxidoreductase n=1 Tax=Kitasatospora sp. Root187 TaxID=1736486 RepID=UPI00070DECE7|nr:3-oxoacyl-ACP reductase family protein [Kitasatospora sp. Root187]KRB72570.1 oxidoreductase [Kitasatospora sp. Root187]
MTQQLPGKTALVTGGSRGIGAAIVRHLAADGAAVAFTYNSSKEKAEALAGELGPRVVALPADSSDATALQAAVTATVETFGSLDILVNNAGVGRFAPLSDLTLDDFDDMFSVNVRAIFAAVKAAEPHFTRGSRVINIGSVNGDVSPFPGLSVYSASKAAVSGLTRALARELGPRGITVNNVLPGPVDTDLNPADGEFADVVTPRTALGYYATPDDIAATVAFLASPAARYVTGSDWTVDGGLTA